MIKIFGHAPKTLVFVPGAKSNIGAIFVGHIVSGGEIVPPCFLDNFTKNSRQDLKIGYIDAFHYQLQSVLKIRVLEYKLILKKKNK